jgi:hypothetical protein
MVAIESDNPLSSLATTSGTRLIAARMSIQQLPQLILDRVAIKTQCQCSHQEVRLG